MSLDNQIDPRECMYRLGASVRKRISKALQNTSDEDAKKCIQSALEKEEDNKQLIDYDTLSWIHKNLQRIDATYHDFFYQLVDQCRVVTPPERRNKELESRLKKLKCQQSNKEYNQMTNGLASGHINTSKRTSSLGQEESPGLASFGSELRRLQPLLLAVLNAVLVVGGAFFFCYKALEYALPQPQVAAQVLFGLVGASLVAIAELYFLVRII